MTCLKFYLDSKRSYVNSFVIKVKSGHNFDWLIERVSVLIIIFNEQRRVILFEHFINWTEAAQVF